MATRTTTSGKIQKTEKQIYTTARSLFFQKGIHNTSIRLIVAEAGTNLGSFTYYYKTKNDLVEKIYRDVCQEIRGLFADDSVEYASLHDYLMMELFQFKTAILNDRYYELYSTAMTCENTINLTHSIYQKYIWKYCQFGRADQNYFVVTSAVLTGMKSELIRLARNDTSKKMLDQCLDFYFYELLAMIYRADYDKLISTRKQLFQEFDGYYADIVKDYTPILTKLSTTE